MDNYIDKLANRVFKTKDARFMASHRMARSRVASKAAESFLSASIICISLISLQVSDVEVSKTISGLTIVLSTFLLVLSLLFSSLDYGKRYDNYNNCGLELNRLYHLIEHLQYDEMDAKELNVKAYQLSEKYENILAKYNQNHTKFDSDYSMLFNDRVTISCLKRLWFKARYYVFDVSFLYWLIALLPIVGIVWFYLRNIYFGI